MANVYRFAASVRQLMVCWVLLVTPAMADIQIPDAEKMNQEPVQLGNYRIYFSAFNSTFIQPEVARQYNLRRGERYGIVNIAVRDVSRGEPGKAVTATVSGHVANLLTQKYNLAFFEINEGEAIYYLADFRFADEERLKFVINVKPQGSDRGETLRFTQTFYRDTLP